MRVRRSAPPALMKRSANRGSAPTAASAAWSSARRFSTSWRFTGGRRPGREQWADGSLLPVVDALAFRRGGERQDGTVRELVGREPAAVGLPRRGIVDHGFRAQEIDALR